jgi:hypothetical protein
MTGPLEALNPMTNHGFPPIPDRAQEGLASKDEGQKLAISRPKAKPGGLLRKEPVQVTLGPSLRHRPGFGSRGLCAEDKDQPILPPVRLK